MEAKTEQDALVKARSLLSVALIDIDHVKTLCEVWGWTLDNVIAAHDAIVAAIEQIEEEAGVKPH